LVISSNLLKVDNLLKINPLITIFTTSIILKKNALNSADKFIAKMLLNQLYGYFGRSRDLIHTKFVDRNTLKNILATSIIKTYIKINDNLFIVLIKSNINHLFIKQLNLTLDNYNVKYLQTSVKSNVAISAAITAYARMVMMDYKNNTNFNVYYSDTDSIFTDQPLPDHLVGDN
jgi:hypothetical protein